MTNVYERLAALAERGRALAVSRHLDELAAVQAEAQALRDALPSAAPPGAEPALLAAAAATAETEQALQAALAELAAGATRLDHGRTAVRGYRAAAGSSSPVRGR
jgi:hypothetical protein